MERAKEWGYLESSGAEFLAISAPAAVDTCNTYALSTTGTLIAEHELYCYAHPWTYVTFDAPLARIWGISLTPFAYA